jgi:hypothetical protein
MLLHRAIDLQAALKMGFRIGLDEIRADEFRAMLTVEEERETLDRERFEDRRP